MDDKEQIDFHRKINELNAIIADEGKLQEEMAKFIQQDKRAVIGVFTPYMNEYVRAVASRHWIPYFLPKNKVLAMINYISCEAQRDVTIGYLNEYVAQGK